MSYTMKERKRISNLIKSNFFNNGATTGLFRKNQYDFILDDAKYNLFAGIYKDVIDYFSINSISFWGGNLTNHTLSSQVACLNHLFLLRKDKEAVLSIIKNIDPEVCDVSIIEESNFIAFEFVGDRNYLNESTNSRGTNCTSIDALIYSVRNDGEKVLNVIEWKYTESYGNINKANDKRINRYDNLINISNQLISLDKAIYYFEPFYQLMRQTLWAEQLIRNKDKENIKADDFLHIHVIPFENRELLDKEYPVTGMGLLDTWKSQLKDPNKYTIISPKEFILPIDKTKYEDLIEYLECRYW